MSEDDDAVLTMAGVTLVEGDTTVLRSIDWSVRPGERWVLLGPNGAGKTSLLRLASLYRHPSSGRLTVLGGELGRMDVRSVRTRIGLASPALGDQLRREVTALDAVMTARNGALEAWWHTYDDADRADAHQQLEHFGIAHRADHTIGTLSAGERQRTLLARAFAGAPGLVLLDEPTAGLDLRGREDLLGRLSRLARVETTPPLVLVTHHVEEIPEAFTHLLIVDRGAIAYRGPLAEGLTADRLSRIFGLDLELAQRDGRYQAWASPTARSPRSHMPQDQ